MKIIHKPYTHLISENYLNNDEYNSIKNNISFNEIRSYCTNPDNPEYDPSKTPNYSIPVEYHSNLGWLLEKFGNQQLFSTLTKPAILPRKRTSRMSLFSCVILTIYDEINFLSILKASFII